MKLAACHNITASGPVASLCDTLQHVALDGSYWAIMIINMAGVRGNYIRCLEIMSN